MMARSTMTIGLVAMFALSDCGSGAERLFESAGGAGADAGMSAAGGRPSVGGTTGAGAGPTAAGAGLGSGGESAGGDAGNEGGAGGVGGVDAESMDAGAGGGGMAPPTRGGQGGGVSQGGVRGGAGGATSSAGRSGSGGAVGSAAGSSAAGSGPTEEGCEGEVYGGICWYLGGAGESCTEACATHGGVDPESTAYVGTRAQGGSADACAAILDLLGYDDAVESGNRADGVGAGCYLFGTDEVVAWWQSAPSFSPNASLALASLACGCAE